MSTKKNLFKIPCVCGHSHVDHDNVEAPIWEEWCDKCMGCFRYRPDNLKYLQRKYESGKAKEKK